MSIEELKVEVEACRGKLAEDDSGKFLVAGPDGPVGIGLIDAVVSAIETLDQRLYNLENDISQLKR